MSETLRATVAEMKATALDAFARGLSAATTLEEARGLALIAMRGMLDIIYPEEPEAAVALDSNSTPSAPK